MAVFHGKRTLSRKFSRFCKITGGDRKISLFVSESSTGMPMPCLHVYYSRENTGILQTAYSFAGKTDKRGRLSLTIRDYNPACRYRIVLDKGGAIRSGFLGSYEYPCELSRERSDYTTQLHIRLTVSE